MIMGISVCLVIGNLVICISSKIYTYRYFNIHLPTVRVHTYHRIRERACVHMSACARLLVLVLVFVRGV